MSIPESSSSSLTEWIRLTFMTQIDDSIACFRIGNNGSNWYFDNQIFSLGTVHLFCSSIFSILSPESMGMTKVGESIHIGCRTKVRIPSVSPISSVRTSIRDTLLATP